MQTAEVMESVAQQDAGPEIPKQPTHVVECGECHGTATYRPTASGSGFMILAVAGFGADATFSIGDHGRPVCPNGHGEMALADEQLPTAQETITEFAERLNEAKQAPLPGVFPAFNYQGAYLELEAQAERVARLKDTAKEDAETARESRKAWEKAAELLTAMAQEFERRRREKSAPADPENAGGALVPCLFEQRNPQVPCPLCDGSMIDIDHSQIFERDTESHVVQAQDAIARRKAGDLCELLDALANMRVPTATVLGWTDEERDSVGAWVTALENDDDPLPPRPAALGTMHVAARVESGGEAQVCTQCDQVLIAAGEDANYYEPGTLVGTDCKGQPQRYPKRGGKKRAGK